jgi:L-amino acid N-acyltransferase YncA
VKRATRVAVVSDLPAIVEIYNQAVEANATGDLDPLGMERADAWLREHPPASRPVLVCEEGSEILGWSSLSEYRPGRRALRHSAEISYYVRFSHHRQGVASQLVRECIALAPELGIRTLFAILLDDNRASVRLLERFGFARWGHMPRVADFGGREVGHLYYGRRVDAEPAPLAPSTGSRP